MRLKDLCGEHRLSGVEIGTAECIIWNEDEPIETNCVRFTIDNRNLIVVEDPDDGYRSYCGDIYETDEVPKYTFPGVRVYGYMGEGTEEDILIMREMTTNKIVLKIGTDTSDSYYPCCIFDWRPENLSINSGREVE